jgi:hypothetical protein
LRGCLEVDAKAARRVPAVDQDLVTAHGEEPARVGHASGVIRAHARRRGSCHLSQGRRRRVEDLEQFGIRRLTVSAKVDAKPTTAGDGQVSGEPADPVAYVGDGRTHIPSEVAGCAGRPIPVGEGLEHPATYARGSEEVVGSDRD